MAVPRRHHNATSLPDGQVLVTGGTRSPGFNQAAQAVREAAVYNPDANTWSTKAPMVRSRVYHSTALLLPDGRILSAGGGVPNAGGDVDHRNAEIYSPPYLFNGPRPSIASSPSVVKYGQTLCIQTPDAQTITKVTLIRLGAVTHAFDENQRLVTLPHAPSACASGSSANRLNATVPVNANLLPPGHYMLFIVNSAGVPSLASMTQVLSFTDPGGTPGETGPEPGTPLKAVHIRELRTRVNAVRMNKCGLSAFAFTDPLLQAGNTAQAVHVTQLRIAVNEAEATAACSLPATMFTDPIIMVRLTPIKAVHVAQLRAAVETLELR